jgi:endo-1,4-beta-xylanase
MHATIMSAWGTAMLNGSRLDRRAFLRGAGASLIAAAGPVRIGPAFGEDAGARIDPDAGSGTDPAGPTLRERAGRKGILFGAAARSGDLLGNPAYADAFARECALLVPEWEAKWGAIRPGPDEFTFDAVDQLWDFTRRHGLGFRGHALVWHEHVPRWLAEIDGAEARRALESHIRRVASRYPGVQSWDVVNEAVEVDDGLPDGLRDSVWLKAMGPSYIHEAFVMAREANPETVLVYNDYGVDYGDRASRKKRTALLRLLETLKNRGTPVDTLGIQGHLNPSRSFDARSFQHFLHEVADLGLGLYITELDVNDRDLPPEARDRDRQAADHALEYLEIALAEPAVQAVFTWGLSDRFTWRNEFSYSRRQDGLPARTLPLDAEMRRKPLWTAIARALDGVAPRGGKSGIEKP